MTSTKLLHLTLALCALCAAASAVLFSGAWFASVDANGASSVSTARIELHLLAGGEPATGTVLIPADGLRPGETDARTRIVELKNAGDVPAKLALDFADAPTGAGLQLLHALNLIVDDCGADDQCASPTQAFSGSLPDATDVDFPPALATGASRFVRLRLRWPEDNDDPSLYGVSTQFAFHWSATTS